MSGAWNEAGQSEDPAVALLEQLGYAYAPPETLEAEREHTGRGLSHIGACLPRASFRTPRTLAAWLALRRAACRESWAARRAARVERPTDARVRQAILRVGFKPTTI